MREGKEETREKEEEAESPTSIVRLTWRDKEVKAQFLEHTVRLNDLYVALAEGCARQRISPSRYPFWWISTDNVGLPWQELSGRTGRMEERRLVPERRRYPPGG